MIIGFSKKTSKILPKILCKNFRHCALILELNKKQYLLLNPYFKKINIFLLNKRDLEILKQNGWVFIKIKPDKTNLYTSVKSNISCVWFVKNAIGIHNLFIWTPDQLYKKLTKNKLCN